MRQSVLFILLSFAAFSVAAQQQAPRKDATKKEKGESSFERRQRVDGAAGGTAPVPKDQREGVGAGAKRHMHFDQLDRGLHRRSDAEVIAPAK